MNVLYKNVCSPARVGYPQIKKPGASLTFYTYIKELIMAKVRVLVELFHHPYLPWIRFEPIDDTPSILLEMAKELKEDGLEYRLLEIEFEDELYKTLEQMNFLEHSNLGRILAEVVFAALTQQRQEMAAIGHAFIMVGKSLAALDINIKTS